jgi:hypothetical protein
LRRPGKLRAFVRSTVKASFTADREAIVENLIIQASPNDCPATFSRLE